MRNVPARTVANSGDKIRVSGTIRQTQTADGRVLLDIRHGRLFTLNLVGARILQLLERGFDEPRITDEISREYGADYDVVRTDVLEFIESLEKNDVLQTVPDASGL
ncbi:MAG: PqqD family protein [Candidatus Acidiferrum sp.]